MTTDSGANWVFVPIDSQWLRFGEYTLTTGLIPEGYWTTHMIFPPISHGLSILLGMMYVC